MVHHRNSAKTIKLAVVLDSVVKPQVILESDTGMAASAHVFGVPAPHLSTDLEHMRLNTFLLDLREVSVYWNNCRILPVCQMVLVQNSIFDTL